MRLEEITDGVVENSSTVAGVESTNTSFPSDHGSKTIASINTQSQDSNSIAKSQKIGKKPLTAMKQKGKVR